MAQGNITNNKIKKIIVAVHGVGDQFRYATIQSVITRFSAHNGHPATVPLGSFHAELKTPDQRKPLKFGELAFTEVYWADIPDKVVRDGHTLEEPRSWARTIVDRLQMRGKAELRELEEEIKELKEEQESHAAMKNYSDAAKCLSCLEGKRQVKDAYSKSRLEEADYSMLKQALDEMIQTLTILERLSLLADRAGVFTFDLKNLLDCYLGDVQIVTEFREQRRKILGEFKLVMAEAHRFAPQAEIYIVAHSEGTVVSFLGLLEALSAVQRPAWVNQVRGLMTLGSPIDKHLILWPEELWGKFEATKSGKVPDPNIKWPPTPLPEPIKWYNYYDYGDPIGYDLNEAREWLLATGWDKVFDFQKENDIGFWRYPLPGKAHVDYWKDEEVFSHFIENVALKQPAAPQSNKQPAAPQEPQEKDRKPVSDKRPRSKPWPLLTSYVFPYVGVGALLFAAAFILYKALYACLDPKVVPPSNEVFRNVLGMTCLLYGVTVTARIPRLTRIWYWRLLGPALYALSAIAYFRLLSDGKLGVWLETNFGFYRPCMSRFLLTLAVLIIVTLIGSFGRSRSYGFKPLIGLGGLAVAALVVFQVIHDKGDRRPIWPLILATLGFMYLWWLAALIFDLVFVWHFYIRWSTALKRMGKIVASPHAREEWKKTSSRKTKQGFKTGVKAGAIGA